MGDLNGDGKPDISLTCEVDSYMCVYQNLSTPGSFTNTSLAGRVDYVAGWNPHGVAIGDLDGDGRPDVVFGNTYDNTVSIFQNEVPFGNLPPVITGFSPISGPAGISVTISGTNFSPVAANNTVYFGAVRAVVTAASVTNLVVTVPSGATYTPITETVNGLTASASASFLPTFPGGGVFTNSSLAGRVGSGVWQRAVHDGHCRPGWGRQTGSGGEQLQQSHHFHLSEHQHRRVIDSRLLCPGSGFAAGQRHLRHDACRRLDRGW
jgi:hypothetical protein